MSKSNGVFFVIAEGQEFLVYWVRVTKHASCSAECHRRPVDTVQGFG